MPTTYREVWQPWPSWLASASVWSPPTCRPTYKGKPYKDKAQTVPGKIMLAYYDEGGEGVAYHEPRPLKAGNFRARRGSTAPQRPTISSRTARRFPAITTTSAGPARANG